MTKIVCSWSIARRRSITLDRLVIAFRPTSPSRLYWADRPAMQVVQALHWLKDTLGTDRERVLARLAQVLTDPTRGQTIADDLLQSFSMLPAWMQGLVRELPALRPGVTETHCQRLDNVM